MKWKAKFDENGFVSIEPDTPETRRELVDTLRDFHEGRLQPAEPPTGEHTDADRT